MIRTQPLKMVFAFAAVASILLLAGCHKEEIAHSGKLTRENFAKIHKDMTGSDIEAFLGTGATRRPTTTADPSGVPVPAEEYDWTEGDTWISVIFVGGQAVSWDSHGLP